MIGEIMSNDKSLLGTLLEKGDLPGITQNHVVNQAHPGYFEPIGERNMGQENLAAMGVTPEIEQAIFDMVTGSGAPMAMGSVAKGGSNLLQRLLAKFKNDRAVKKSIRRYKNKPELNFQNRKEERIWDAYDPQPDWERHLDDLYSGEGTLGPEMTLDEFFKELK